MANDRFGLVARRLFAFFASTVATILLGGALVASSTLSDLLNANLGYEPEGVATIRLAIVRSTIDGPHFALRRRELADRARQAGMDDLAFVNKLAIRSEESGFLGVRVGDQRIMAETLRVEGDFFRVLGVPLTGVASALSDGEVVLSASAAGRLFDSEPIGQSVIFEGDQIPKRVVGVVPDLRTVDQGQSVPMQAFLGFDEINGSELPDSTVQIQLLGICAPRCSASIPVLIQLLSGIGGVIVLRAETLSDAIGVARGNAVIVAQLWSIFGFIATGVSLLAVMSMARQNAARMRAEIGTRLALGATVFQVLVRVVREPLIAGASGSLFGVFAVFVSLGSVSNAFGDIALPSSLELFLAGLVLVASAVLVTVLTVLRTVRANPRSLLQSGAFE